MSVRPSVPLIEALSIRAVMRFATLEVTFSGREREREKEREKERGGSERTYKVELVGW